MYSPGLAAPGYLHHEDNEDNSSDLSCSHRTWSTLVQEEVHLTVSQLFKVVLEGIYAMYCASTAS